MNPDEIVKALRCEHGHLTNRGRDFMLNYTREEFFKILNESADLIESMQSQLADYHHMSELVDGKMEENQRLRRINENLQANLAASRRETRAAVADIPRCCATCAYAKANSGSQELCPWFDDCNQVDGDHWQWRDPQEAEEGATK